MGGNSVAGTNVSSERGIDAFHIFFPLSTLLNNGINYILTNNSLEEDFGGCSRLCNNFVIKPMV